MKKMRVEDLWTGYLENVVPKEACDAQVHETRLAFYAGASMLFHVLIGVIGDPDTSEAQGERMMAAIEIELRQFMEMVASSNMPNA